MFFDQPNTHHNPQRDPFPPAEIYDPDVFVDGVPVAAEIFKKFRGPWSQVAFPQSHLRKALDTPAARAGFLYIGSNSHASGGYFFSPYRASEGEKLLRAFGQALEGTLFDWQLGDFFKPCEAGDIRVSFEAQTPSVVSVVGKVSAAGEVVPIVSSKGFKVALSAQGSVALHEMLNDEVGVVREEQRACWGLAIILLALIFVVVGMTDAK